MKLVLFDLDGTLLNAGPCGVSSLNKTVEKLYGKKPVYEINALIGKTDIHNFKYLYKIAFKKNPAAAQFAAMRADYLKNLKEEVSALFKSKKSKPVAGAENLLKILSKNKDIKLALCTGNFEEAARIKLAPHKLGRYFETGGFGDKALDRVSLIALAVKNAEKFYKTKFAADDIFVIGDTYIDITAAKQLGCHNAAVYEAALGDMEKLHRAAAELEVKNFKDTALWLMWIGVKADPKGVEKGSYIMPATAIEHVFFSRTGIDEQRLKMFRIKKYSDIESGKLI